jgi:dTDP-4-amino-4,6-dideoxygalactose transaminase
VHRLPVYADHYCHLPVAELAAREVLSLPMGPMLPNAAIGRVADALRAAFAANGEATVAA